MAGNRLKRLALLTPVFLVIVTLKLLAASSPPQVVLAQPVAAVTVSPWPGGSAVQTVDALNGPTIPPATNNTNLSGLAYEASGSAAPGVLWAVRNGPERLYRFIWDGSIWTPDANSGWATGKELRYPDGTTRPDTEGIAFATSPADGIYVSAERNNAVGAVRRNSILRFDASATSPLNATHEWNLTADLPAAGGAGAGAGGGPN